VCSPMQATLIGAAAAIVSGKPAHDPQTNKATEIRSPLGLVGSRGIYP
jgi:hypothetical protein